jgi:hypothetical protein
MSSCSSCSSAYATAQSYVRDQLNNFQKPQQDTQVSNDVDSSPSLNSSGRGQLLNISA